MAINKTSLFQFRAGSTFLYQMPPALKILLMFFTGTASFFVSLEAGLALFALSLLAGFRSGFSLRCQLSAVKPLFYYAPVLYASSFINGYAVPRQCDIELCLKLALALQAASLLFRTTSLLSLRQGVADIEIAIRRMLPVQKKARFAEVFSFFLLFIPVAASAWGRVDCAWRCRGGKNGVKKIAVLFPLFISLCMRRAYIIERAIRNRHEHELLNTSTAIISV